MYETSKEQEEKRLAEEAAKLKKRKLIDTIVVVIIVGIISAVVYANWDKIMGTKKEDNKISAALNRAIKKVLKERQHDYVDILVKLKESCLAYKFGETVEYYEEPSKDDLLNRINQTNYSLRLDLNSKINLDNLAFKDNEIQTIFNYFT